MTRETAGETRTGFPQTPSAEALRATILYVSPEGLTRLARIAAAVGLVCAVGASGFFAQPSWAQGKQERRVVAVNVLNEEGQQVTGLTVENFRGKYRGQPVKIVSVDWDTEPRRVVIVLDRSGSMEWGNKLLIARKAAEDLVLYGPPENQIGLVWFSTKPAEIVPLEPGRKHVIDHLAGMMKGKGAQAEGRTALLDGLMEGVRLLQPAQFGDALYVVTDGGDNASRSDDREVQDAMLCSGIRVYFLLFLDPDRSMRGPEYASGPGLADELSKGSGGFALTPATLQYGSLGRFELSPEEQTELASSVRWLYGQIAEAYRVEVELPVEVDKTRGWELEVVGAEPSSPQGVPQGKGKRMKDVKVVYPRKVAKCGDGER